jgi:hypothetical protein
MRTPLLYALLQVAPRDGLSTAADIAVVVIGLAVVVLAVVTAALLLRLIRVIGELRIGVRQNLGPVSDRARAISDNVEFITQALRTDVERLNASVRALTDRLQLASERMEERIEDFNALMEVVQDEAEGIFIDTASTVRGVRAGARSIAGGGESTDGARRGVDRRLERERPSAEGDRDGESDEAPTFAAEDA